MILASKVEGITVSLGLDTSPVSSGLKGLNKEINSTQKELSNVQRLLKFNPDDTTLLTQKHKLLGDQVQNSKTKLEALREAEKQLISEQKNVDSKEFRDLQQEIVKTKNKLSDYEDQMSKSNVTLEKMGAKVDAFASKSESLGKSMLPLTAALGGIAAGSIAAMDNVDEGLDRVMTATGATGDAAKELQEVYYNVAQTIPDDFANIGGAIGELNTRLGLLDEELESAAESTLKFSKANGVDATEGVKSVTRMMKNAGIPTSEYAHTLDVLTKAGQISGANVLTLAESYTKNGAALRALNYDNEEAIGMLAKWEVEGVNVEVALAGMKKAVVNFTNDNKDAKVEIKNVIDEIKNLSASGDDLGATTLAMETFGNKAGPELKDAIALGKFEYQDFIEQVENSQGTLEDTYGMIVDEVDDTQLATQIFQIALHDLGEVISKTIGPILKDLATHFKNLMEKFNALDPAVQTMIVVLGGIVMAIGPCLLIVSKLATCFSSLITFVTPLVNTLFPSLAGAVAIPMAPIIAIVAAIGALIAAIVYLFATNEEFRNDILEIWEIIKQALSTILDFILENFSFVFDAIKGVIDTALNIIMDLVDIFIALFKGDWEGLWIALQKLVMDIVTGVLDYFQTMYDGIMEVFSKAVEWVIEQIMSLISTIIEKTLEFFNAGKEIMQSVWDGMVSVWEGFKSWVTSTVDWLMDKLFFWRSAQDEMSGGDGGSSKARVGIDFDGSHEKGLWDVPFDGYRAIVHKGEMIVPSNEADKLRKGQPGTEVNVTQNIYTKSVNAQAQQRQAARELKKLALEV